MKRSILIGREAKLHDRIGDSGGGNHEMGNHGIVSWREQGGENDT